MLSVSWLVDYLHFLISTQPHPQSKGLHTIIHDDMRNCMFSENPGQNAQWLQLIFGNKLFNFDEQINNCWNDDYRNIKDPHPDASFQEIGSPIWGCLKQLEFCGRIGIFPPDIKFSRELSCNI